MYVFLQKVGFWDELAGLGVCDDDAVLSNNCFAPPLPPQPLNPSLLYLSIDPPPASQPANHTSSFLDNFMFLDSFSASECLRFPCPV
jgi:hypothetical protein